MDGLLDILFALRDFFTSEGILNTRTSSCSTQVADWSDLGTVSDSLSVDSSMLLHGTWVQVDDPERGWNSATCPAELRCRTSQVQDHHSETTLSVLHKGTCLVVSEEELGYFKKRHVFEPKLGPLRSGTATTDPLYPASDPNSAQWLTRCNPHRSLASSNKYWCCMWPQGSRKRFLRDV
jgi:hypothetical protein